MKKSILFLLFFCGALFYASAQNNANSESGFVPANNLRSKKIEASENSSPNNSETYSNDPVIEGAHTIITVDRYGNRTETIVPPVTVSQKRTELNKTLESLQSKLFAAQNETPVDALRIQEIELKITQTEQELNALPQ